MSLNDLRREVVDTISSLYQRGLITAYGGNISARVKGKDQFVITPSRIPKGGLKPRDIVLCDMKANLIKGEYKPSVEAPVHASVYRHRSDVNAVIHAHNPIATAMGIAGVALPPLTAETILVLGEVPILPYLRTGTREMEETVAKSIANHSVIILKNHGVIAVGANLRQAEIKVETLEHEAWTTLLAKLFGEVTAVPSDEVEYIKSHMPPL